MDRSSLATYISAGADLKVFKNGVTAEDGMVVIYLALKHWRRYTWEEYNKAINSGYVKFGRRELL